jgi:pimeloyl-ACP methyl ester carboxylesterase
MNKLFKRFMLSIAALAALWLVSGLILIATPAPAFAGKPFVLKRPAPPACVESADTRCFTMRDGQTLHAAFIAASGERPLVLFLHGVMSSADELRPAAAALHDASGAAIVSLDLRGHGTSAGRFGDIDYIGQYEDDVADVIAALRRTDPQRRLILAGHSMGGGVALRYAAKGIFPQVDGYLLFAPHLGEDAPTTRHEPVAAGAGEAPIKLHLKRTIGLLMLNTFGITAFNGLGTLYFNVADAAGLLNYSFRAMATCAPDDYRAALGADDKPLLIVAGSKDEAFDAAQYPLVAQLHHNGRAQVVADETHDGILGNRDAIAAAAAWLR